MVHGFLRNSDGTFTTFDPTESVATYPLGVNATHVIVGTYNDAHGILHGFIRSADGKIAPYDAPGAGGGEGEGTILEAINTSGESVGYYLDANSSYHGFLLTSTGTFTQFDAPHAGTGHIREPSPQDSPTEERLAEPSTTPTSRLMVFLEQLAEPSLSLTLHRTPPLSSSALIPQRRWSGRIVQRPIRWAAFCAQQTGKFRLLESPGPL